MAEWDDGIPPDPTSCLRSQRLSLYLKDLIALRILQITNIFLIAGLHVRVFPAPFNPLIFQFSLGVKLW